MRSLAFTPLFLFALLLVVQAGHGRGRGRHLSRGHRGGYGYAYGGRYGAVGYGVGYGDGYGGGRRNHGRSGFGRGDYYIPPAPPTDECKPPCEWAYGVPGQERCVCYPPTPTTTATSITTATTTTSTAPTTSLTLTTSTTLTETPTTMPATTTTPSACVALSPSSQAGIIVDNGVIEDPSVSWPVVASCASCTAGTKRFYNTATTAKPFDALANGQMAMRINIAECASLCVCEKAGECYEPGPEKPAALEFYAYCTSEACHMYALQDGPKQSSMVGRVTSKTLKSLDQIGSDGGPKDMDPNASPQPYILAASVSCSGCISIEKAACTGPAMPA